MDHAFNIQLSHEPTQFLRSHMMNNKSFINKSDLKAKREILHLMFLTDKILQGYFFKPISHDISRVPRILRGHQWGRLLMLPVLCVKDLCSSHDIL